MVYDMSFEINLSGKNALVTGAGRGIGLAAASALAEAGACVTLVARTRDEIEAAAKEIGQSGNSAKALAFNVLDTKETEETISKHGPFDILINNAGTNRPSSLFDVSHDDYDAIMDLNVRAAFFTAKAVANGLRQADKPGSIINMSSQMGHVGAVNRTVYCASKHAMEGFTKAMAVELGPLGIRVNTVCPTFIETPMTKPFLEDTDFKDSVLNQIPLGRVGQVNDVAGAVVFLASQASSLITGAALKVDGGWTAH